MMSQLNGHIRQKSGWCRFAVMGDGASVVALIDSGVGGMHSSLAFMATYRGETRYTTHWLMMSNTMSGKPHQNSQAISRER
jgi:hypothetical protein